jgi:hypothetical protein
MFSRSQSINAETRVNSWGCDGERAVNGAEIAERIQAMMGNESLRGQAMFIREEEARKKF